MSIPNIFFKHLTKLSVITQKIPILCESQNEATDFRIILFRIIAPHIIPVLTAGCGIQAFDVHQYNLKTSVYSKCIRHSKSAVEPCKHRPVSSASPNASIHGCIKPFRRQPSKAIAQHAKVVYCQHFSSA